MICIGNYPCSLNPQHIADLAVVGKSDPQQDGYDVFLRAYCSDCAQHAITKKGEAWAPMDDVYVEFAKRGKVPHPVTSWNNAKVPV